MVPTLETEARVQHHVVTVDGAEVTCSCKAFRVRSEAWGPSHALALAHGHAANPSATTEELLAFIGGEK